ncbi:hypothetical protein M0813_27537 [Anaeramoeba flamelloides]|uniref:Phosphatidic acid phosphatase type 2/haloperoxidase domain-containing protein n=1 Tax=Anaeramoeba flamelloides TaxID=1746091 RepID=A0ABQ8XXX0_9EUKA|nr:hypothetical protein M0813_27537 [Anaeramoeba flamelloides]
MLKITTFCILFFLVSLHTAECSQVCKNENSDMFLNKCFKEYPNGFWTLLADTIKWWVNPRTDVIIVAVMIFGLPVIMFGTKKRDYVSKALYSKFLRTKFALLNLLHRICYGLVLDVILYTIFKQKRPCKCDLDGSGNYVHIGSIYGMPSGDAMNGAIVAMSIFDFAPINVVGSRIFSTLILLIVMAERVALGYHTIGQVTAGASIGIVLHFCSTRLPQWFNFAASSVQFILSWWVLILDNDNIKVEKGSFNNLYAWVMWGNCFLLIEFFLSFRMWSKVIGWSRLKYSYASILKFLKNNKLKLYQNTLRQNDLFEEYSANQDKKKNLIESESLSSELGISSQEEAKETTNLIEDKEEKNKVPIVKISDFWYDFVVFLVFGFGFMFFQDTITQYAYPV